MNRTEQKPPEHNRNPQNQTESDHKSLMRGSWDRRTWKFSFPRGTLSGGSRSFLCITSSWQPWNVPNQTLGVMFVYNPENQSRCSPRKTSVCMNFVQKGALRHAKIWREWVTMVTMETRTNLEVETWKWPNVFLNPKDDRNWMVAMSFGLYDFVIDNDLQLKVTTTPSSFSACRVIKFNHQPWSQ